MIPDYLLSALASTGFSAVLFAVAIFIGREAIKRALDRSVARQLERHKHELAVLQDRIKHDLQKDLLNAQYKAGAIHKIYPEFYEKLEDSLERTNAVCQGTVIPNYKGFTLDDVKEHLVELKATNKDTREILDLYKQDPDSGLKRLGEFYFQTLQNEARESRRAARFYLTGKALYFTPVLYDECLKTVNDLATAGTKCSHPYPGAVDRAYELLGEAREALKRIESMMREELSPRP